MALYVIICSTKLTKVWILCSSPANFGRVCLRLAIVLALLAGLILMSELLNPHQVWPGHCAPSHCQARTGASELDILSQVQVVDIQVIFAGNQFFFSGWRQSMVTRRTGQDSILCHPSFPWWSSICAPEHSIMMVAGPYLRQRYQSSCSLLLMELAESTSCRTISVDPVIICLYMSIICCYILAYNAISQ